MTDQTDPAKMTTIEDWTPAEITKFLAVEVMGLATTNSAFNFWSVGGNICYFDPIRRPRDRDMLVDRMLELGWNCTEHHYRPSHVGQKHEMHVLCEQFHVFARRDILGDAVCLAAVKAVMSMKEKDA